MNDRLPRNIPGAQFDLTAQSGGGPVDQPVHVSQRHISRALRARAHHDASSARFGGKDNLTPTSNDRSLAKTLGLSNGVTANPVVTTNILSISCDNVTRFKRIGPKLRDHVHVAAGRDEADVLTIRLFRDREAESLGDVADRPLVRHAAKRKQAHGELLTGCRREKPALIARLIGSAM